MWAWRFWHQTELLARVWVPSVRSLVPFHCFSLCTEKKSHLTRLLMKHGNNNNNTNFCLLIIICYPRYFVWCVNISCHCAFVSLKRENDCDLKQNFPWGRRWHGGVTQTISQEPAEQLGFLPIRRMTNEYLHTVLLSNLRNATQTKHQQRERGRWGWDQVSPTWSPSGSHSSLWEVCR